jgi:hypothetical protein
MVDVSSLISEIKKLFLKVFPYTHFVLKYKIKKRDVTRWSLVVFEKRRKTILEDLIFDFLYNIPTLDSAN